MLGGVKIRKATPDDHPIIRAINERAFGQPEEADLVERLRAGGLVIRELVAEVEGAVVGHILFTTLLVEGERAIRAAALAPMAVDPDAQGQGVGSAMVVAGLSACREQGYEAVIVLGHPEFYPRFGFSAEAARRLIAPFSGPAFMALELVPGTLGAGRVSYPAAFQLETESPDSPPAD